MPDRKLEFPFSQGIREDIPETSLQMPMLREAENVTFDRAGELVKRGGFERLLASAATRTISAIFSHKERILIADSSRARVYGSKSDTTGNMEYDLPYTSLKSIVRGPSLASSDQFTVSTAVTDDTIGMVWVDADGDVQLIVFDRFNEAILTGPTTVSATADTASGARVGATSDALVVTWRVNADNEIQARLYTDNGNPQGANVVLVSNVKTGAQAYDMTMSGTTAAPTVVISYADTTDDLEVAEFSAASASFTAGNTFSASAQNYTETAIFGETDTTEIWVAAMRSGGEVDTWVLDQSLSSTASATNILSATTYTNLSLGKASADHACIVAFANTSVRPTGTFEFGSLNTSAALDTASSVAFGGWPAAAPFTDGENVYLPIFVTLRSIDGTDPINTQHMVVRLFSDDTSSDSEIPVIAIPLGYNATPVPGYPSTETNAAPPKLGAFGSTEHLFGAVRSEETTSARWIRVGYRVTSNTIRKQTAARSSSSLYVAGGMVSQFVGDNIPELGFSYYPRLDTAGDVVAASGGSLATGGTYQYALMYEWTDGDGNAHRSAPHFTSSYTLTTGENSFTIDFPYYRHSRKYIAENPVRLVVYRTSDGPTGLFQRAKEADNDPTSSGEGSLTDTISDADLADNEILYATGGILDHIAIPPSIAIAEHGGRLFGVDAERPGRIWFTKQFTPGSGPGHNEALQILVEDTDGPVNGLASMDGVLYALKLDGIYRAAIGDGPNNAGGGTVYPEPTLVSRRAGCDSPLSVLEGPDGIYFAGPWENGRTIFLFPRGEGEPIPIGDRVRDTLETYPVVRRAVHRQTEGRIEFVVVDSETNPTAGRLLYYHYSTRDKSGIGAWTVASLDDGVIVPLDAAIALDGTGSGPTTWVVAEDGGDYLLLRQRLSGSRTDDSSGYRQRIVTGDQRPFGADGWGNVRRIRLRLGYPGDSCTARVETSYDGGSTYTDDVNWSLGATGSPQPSSGDVIELESWGSIQVTDRVRYRITITTTDQVGDETGVRLLNTTLSVRPKRGVYPAADVFRR